MKVMMKSLVADRMFNMIFMHKIELHRLTIVTILVHLVVVPE